MIYVEMGGRYGNQLFHYACARYVMLKSGDNDLVLNFSSILEKNKETEGWKDVLTDLNVVPYSYYKKQGTVLKNETSLLQKLLVAVKATQIKLHSKKTREERANEEQWFSSFLNRTGIYWIREGLETIEVNRNLKKYIVTGTCECPSVFKDIGDVLRDELTPKLPPQMQSEKYLKMMEETESVCINVRRGDFFNTEFEKSFGVCTIDYYRKAYNRMLEQRLNKPHFFVISDDINWCRDYLNFATIGGSITFVPDDLPPYETMRLISNCKHFIISNSTFSWWGCYLSKNKNKIVISPSRWNNDGYDSRLIGEDWILIDP